MLIKMMLTTITMKLNSQDEYPTSTVLEHLEKGPRPGLAESAACVCLVHEHLFYSLRPFLPKKIGNFFS